MGDGSDRGSRSAVLKLSQVRQHPDQIATEVDGEGRTILHFAIPKNTAKQRSTSIIVSASMRPKKFSKT